MTRASSEAIAPAAPPSASRIIAAEVLGDARVVPLAELAGARQPAALRPRDLDTEVGRAAYAMGRRRGYDEGLRAGREQGLREGSHGLMDFQSAKAAEVARPMQQVLDAFRRELGRLEEQVAQSLTQLAVDIAREVLRRELQTDPKALLPVVEEAVRALGEGASRIDCWVNPVDAALLRGHLQALSSQAHWQVHDDPGLLRGGCRIESDTGVADARVQARWEAVMATLGRSDPPALDAPAEPTP